MKTLFVAGAGTDVGKTYATCALIRRLRAEGRRVLALKPVASGMSGWDDPLSDTARLLEAQGLPLNRDTVEACTPWRFTAALAPDMAAAREGRRVTLDEVLAFHARAVANAPEDATVIVEGVGGLMSPATSDALCLDWVKALACPALIVSGSYLGAISHALTASETLARHGVALAGMIVSETEGSPVPLDETTAAIARHAGAPVHALPRGAAWPEDALGAALGAASGLA